MFKIATTQTTTQASATTNKRKKLEDAYDYSQPTQSGISQLSEYKNIVNQNQSALSSLQSAKEQAMRSADVSALAQGYATQGAYQQQMGDISNVYANRLGAQQQLAQQQIGALQDTASQNAFQNFSSALANAEAQGTLDSNQLNALQQAYFGQMSGQDLTNARTLIDQYNRNIEAENRSSSTIFEGNTSGGKTYKVDKAALISNPNNMPSIVFNGQELSNSLMMMDNSVPSTYVDPSSLDIGELTAVSTNDGDYLAIKVGENDVRIIIPRFESQKYLDQYTELLGSVSNKKYGKLTLPNKSQSSGTSVGSNYKSQLNRAYLEDINKRR